eukprot:1114716-Lingulodinium_polyedra.AAC.1
MNCTCGGCERGITAMGMRFGRKRMAEEGRLCRTLRVSWCTACSAVNDACGGSVPLKERGDSTRSG